MKINKKLSIIISLLVILPSITIGMVAYREAKKGLIEQHESVIDLVKQEVEIQSDVNFQLADIIHEYAAKNISTEINIAREKFFEMCGTYADLDEDGESLVCESGMKLNDVYYSKDLVKEIKKIIGKSSIFSKISETEAKKISTTQMEDVYKYGYMMEKSMFDKLIINGDFYNEFTKIKGIYKTKNCDPIKNSNGDISGAICVGTVETFVAESLIQQLEEGEFGDGGSLYVISLIKDNDKFGHVIAGNDSLKNLNGKNIEFINELINKKNGDIEYVRDGKKNSHLLNILNLMNG
jgi:hypothetical protein